MAPFLLTLALLGTPVSDDTPALELEKCIDVAHVWRQRAYEADSKWEALAEAGALDDDPVLTDPIVIERDTGIEWPWLAVVAIGGVAAGMGVVLAVR